MFSRLRISGKNLPPRPYDMRRKEHLLPLVISIAKKDLGIRINPGAVKWTEREDGGGRKAPIIVQYVFF